MRRVAWEGEETLSLFFFFPSFHVLALLISYQFPLAPSCPLPVSQLPFVVKNIYIKSLWRRRLDSTISICRINVTGHPRDHILSRRAENHLQSRIFYRYAGLRFSLCLNWNLTVIHFQKNQNQRYNLSFLYSWKWDYTRSFLITRIDSRKCFTSKTNSKRNGTIKLNYAMSFSESRFYALKLSHWLSLAVRSVFYFSASKATQGSSS